MAMKRVGILVVHGVGDQGAFQFLESVAVHFYKTLLKEPRRAAVLQLCRGDQAPRGSREESWRERPLRLRWRTLDPPRDDWPEWVEAHFAEVHWADLDLPPTLGRWLAFAGWALSMSGVRLFADSLVWRHRRAVMSLPRPLTGGRRALVRLQLFGLSLLFLLALLTVGLVSGLLTRLAIRVRWVEAIKDTVYNYVGDVKLYQDWFVRTDTRAEVYGEKSRVAIRRRMVRRVLAMAKEVEEGRLDGFYVIAHSLGSVVAFNALMELDTTLPNYLTEREWLALPAAFKVAAREPAPPLQMPRRPPWLGPHDAICRARVLGGLRGFLTIGSPLDKFAAMWPVIVPVNREPLGRDVAWYNVADRQDLVAGRIDLFPLPEPSSGRGGFRLTNLEWTDQWWPFTAHTSYWKAGPRDDRLIDRLIAWVEGAPTLEAPADRYPACPARLLFCLWILVPSLLVCGALAALLSLVVSEPWCSFLWSVPCPASFSVLRALGWVLGGGVALVLTASIARRIWEEARFRR